MKIKHDTVRVDCGEEEDLQCSYSELLNARRREKTVSQCYREYIEEVVKLRLSESIMSELELRRYLNQEANISLENSYALGIAILGEFDAETYILQLAENNIPPHIMNIISGKSKKARDAKFKSLLKKNTKMGKNTKLFFSTDKGEDLALIRQYDAGNIIYKGRLPGDKYDFTVKEKDVIDFIKHGGRVRAKGDGIPSTIYGVGSSSKQAGKIIGLIEIEDETHKRVIITGADHMI